MLRQVTDLFMATSEQARAPAAEAFDGVMDALCADMEAAVRAELAERLAPVADAPRGLVRRLAADDIAVAEPLLRRSQALAEADLLNVVRSQGQAHLRAVSQRPALPVTVSDVIVERGDDTTLGVLLENQTAALSRRAAEAVIDRAQANPALHQAVVDRQNLPPDLLNEMYFAVEARLRRKIAAKNAALDPAALEAALSAGRTRVAVADGVLPPDYADAELYVRGLAASGGVLAHSLPGMLRRGERTRFIVALAEIADIDFAPLARVVGKADLDALAVVCKAADLDRAMFLTLAVLIDGTEAALSKAETYGGLYAKLPRETANRTLRFWRLRRETDLAA